ncbi:hypothetical protein ATO11_14025 [Pseudaestuariivita atlantica]|uniref:SGNH hydrolase-type esterase domain-containing protein n=2 Tax=Pseudaestuariivita atlantica TaxID=1317121 RepID=A0A0L1JMQ4_9RHOB|nr:hypothetical protein ATO11_14025 [Pseudaestuariivita atlantica]
MVEVVPLMDSLAETKADAARKIDTKTGLVMRSELDNPDPDVLVLMINGNEHNTFALFNHPQPFWTVNPRTGAIPDDVAGKTFLPYQVILSSLRQRRENSQPLIRGAVEMFPDARVVMAATPPPIEDKGQLAGHVRKNMANLVKNGVGDPGSRLAAYVALVELMHDEARQYGASFVTAPEAALTADGFLKEELSNDITHGTREYGRMMLDKIIAAATSETEAA